MRFCSVCGRHMRSIDGGKFQCTDIRCKAIFYDNPLPVSVLIARIRFLSGDVGLFMIVRGDGGPCAGKKAFPGGYHERGETSREAAVRETLQETGLQVNAEDLTLAGEAYAPTPNVQILFWLAPEMPESWLEGFVPSDEAPSYAVCTEVPHDVAFNTHADMMKKFLEGALAS